MNQNSNMGGECMNEISKLFLQQITDVLRTARSNVKTAVNLNMVYLIMKLVG